MTKTIFKYVTTFYSFLSGSLPNYYAFSMTETPSLYYYSITSFFSNNDDVNSSPSVAFNASK